MLSLPYTLAAAKTGCPYETGVDRWDIKTSMPDPAELAQQLDLAELINSSKHLPLSPAVKSMIERSRYQGPLSVGGSIVLHEGDKVRIVGYLKNIGCDPDGDYHLNITADAASTECLIVESVDPTRVEDGALRQLAQMARDTVEDWKRHGLPSTPVVVEGQLFLDAHHYSDSRPGGGRGAGYCATNVLEIHPITAIYRAQ